MPRYVSYYLKGQCYKNQTFLLESDVNKDYFSEASVLYHAVSFEYLIQLVSHSKGIFQLT